MNKQNTSTDSLESLNSELPVKYSDKVCFLTTDPVPDLALSICNRLNVPLSEMKIDYFSNGEARPVIKPSVHGKRVFLISSISSNCRATVAATAATATPEKSVNDYLIGVILTVGALRRAGTKHLTLILPSYPYARQDKKDEPHAAISASHIARLLTSSGVNHLICLDLHAAAIQGFFPENVPVDNIYAIAPVKEHIITQVFTNPKYCSPDEDPQTRFVAVSPDEGAFKRTRKYAETLGLKYLCLTKTRDYSQKNHVDETKTQIFGLSSEEIKGKWSIIFDDMCDTFGTIQAAAKKLVESGSAGVIVVVTHGILSGPAIERLNKTPEVVELICSDSMPQHINKQLTKKLSTFSVGPLLAEIIRRRLCKESVSQIFYHT